MAKNGAAKQFMEMNYKEFGTPLFIPASTLGIDFDKLEKLITSALDNYRNRTHH